MVDKKVLITGAKGNLGQELVEVFAKDFEVVVWDREELDITDKADVDKKILELKPQIIINAAAYNAVDKCEDDEKEFELAKKINGYAVGFLAEIAGKINAALIHYSTDYVFGGSKKDGYKESDKASPISNYGRSKLLGEKLLQEIGGKNGLDYYIIRTSKLFGKPGISEVAKKSFFDVMIDLSENREELKVVNEELSSFTYTRDLAKKTLEIVKEKKEKGIYHVANAEPCTWYEAAKYLFEILGRSVKITPVDSSAFPRPAKRPKYSVLLNAKLEPLRSYKEALREYIVKSL